MSTEVRETEMAVADNSEAELVDAAAMVVARRGDSETGKQMALLATTMLRDEGAA